MSKNEKIQLIHPEGKNAPRISMYNYEIFSEAIIQTLTAYQPLTLSEIAEYVGVYLAKNNIEFKGSIEWFTVSVKQHLEAEQIIDTAIEKGRKMHRLSDAI